LAGRLVRLVHTRAEDLLSPLQTGAVMAAAQFYMPDSGWVKIQPGRLGLADLWGGSVREHNREGTL
jgi:hypothetical protein